MNPAVIPAYRRLHRLLVPLIRFFFPVAVSGRENLTDEPVILCPNHSGALDPFLLVAALDCDYPIRIMAKKQVTDLPVLGGILQRIGVFGVDRGHSDIGAIKTAITSLRSGSSLLIFPEGTRVRPGEHIQAKGGVAMMAIRSGVKLQPVYIATHKRLFRKNRVVFGPVYAPVYSGKKGTAEEYQANADEILRQAYALGETG